MVLFTGGGSAGHVTPNIALIESLQTDGWRCEYVGSESGIERKLISGMKVPYHPIASGKLRRYFDWKNFTDPFLIMLGILQSLRICYRQTPVVVFSKGGFVAVPVVVAAWLLRIPVICHESDVTPGLANKICFTFAKKICVNFEQTLRYLATNKAVVTGTPVRQSLLQGDEQRGRQFLGITAGKPLLLVFGGSLGANAINQQIRSVIDTLLKKFAVIHVTGSGNMDESLSGKKGYIQKEYLESEFGDVLAATDIVVSRAGANAIYELLLVRKPHLLIPLSAKASRGDQIINAKTFSRAGFSDVLFEEDLSDDQFLRALDHLYNNRKARTDKLETYPLQDSVTIICDLIKETMNGSPGSKGNSI